jgi:hypothetical protein
LATLSCVTFGELTCLSHGGGNPDRQLLDAALERHELSLGLDSRPRGTDGSENLTTTRACGRRENQLT